MWFRSNSTAGKVPCHGFSLIELLVTMVVLLIITLLVARSLGTNKDVGAAGCQNNLEKIYLALSIYQNDNKGVYPALKDASSPSAPLSLLVPKCTTGTEIFICPASDDKPLPEGESFAGRRISYAYYMGCATNDPASLALVTDAQVDDAPKREGAPLFSANGNKPGNNHGKKGGNLLWCGGEVSISGPAAARDLRFPPSVRLLNPGDEPAR